MDDVVKLHKHSNGVIVLVWKDTDSARFYGRLLSSMADGNRYFAISPDDGYTSEYKLKEAILSAKNLVG